MEIRKSAVRLLFLAKSADRICVMGQQVLFGRATEVLPGQDFGGIELSLRQGVKVHAGLGERGPPYLAVEDFIPQVEPGAGPLRRLDHVGAPPVGPTDPRLEDASVYIMEFELQVLRPQTLFFIEDQSPRLLEVRPGALRQPLKRRVRLRDEPAHCDIDLARFAIHGPSQLGQSIR